MAAFADEDVSASAMRKLTSLRMTLRSDRGNVGILKGIRGSRRATSAAYTIDAIKLYDFRHSVGEANPPYPGRSGKPVRQALDAPAETTPTNEDEGKRA